MSEERTWNPGDSPVLPDAPEDCYPPDARPLFTGFDEFIVESHGVRVLAGNCGASWGVCPLAPNDQLEERVIGYDGPDEAAIGAVAMLRRLRKVIEA